LPPIIRSRNTSSWEDIIGQTQQSGDSENVLKGESYFYFDPRWCWQICV